MSKANPGRFDNPDVPSLVSDDYPKQAHPTVISSLIKKETPTTDHNTEETKETPTPTPQDSKRSWEGFTDVIAKEPAEKPVAPNFSRMSNSELFAYARNNKVDLTPVGIVLRGSELVKRCEDHFKNNN